MLLGKSEQSTLSHLSWWRMGRTMPWRKNAFWNAHSRRFSGRSFMGMCAEQAWGFPWSIWQLWCAKVANYDADKLSSLADNPKIIRNKLKINASARNANVFIKIQDEFDSFDNYIWGFTKREVIYESCDLRTTSPLSDTISKDLKKRGMKFVGSTIIYSYLQAIGVINGHLEGCWKYKKQ